MTKKRKKVVGMIILLFSIFTLMNVAWFSYVQVKYHKFELAVGYDSERQRYFYRDEDDYTYSVSRPYYLQYTGNLAISQVISIDENGNALSDNIVSLIIGPDIFGKYEYGVSIQVLDKNNKESNAAYVSYEFLVNENQARVQSLDRAGCYCCPDILRV